MDQMYTQTLIINGTLFIVSTVAGYSLKGVMIADKIEGLTRD